MTDRLDLPRHYRDQIEALLREHVPGVEVWAYGSRVSGRSHDASDLDLMLRGPDLKRIPSGQLADLTEALEQSNVPIIVQIHDWARLPESFHREIEQEYVVLVENEEQSVRGGWKTVALSDLIDLRLSSVDKKKKDNEQVVQLCNYMDVYSNSFIYADMDFMIATATEREISNCSLTMGDVVITKDSERYDDIGVPALVREDISDLVCGYHLAILRPNFQKLDGMYLFYALNAVEVQQQFHAYANGVTRFGLRKADIGLVEIPLPPLPEQRAIAHILGTLDDKIELNRRMNETLEEMARALFKSWFVDFDPVRAKMEGRDPGLPKHLADLFPHRLVDSELGPIPEGWEVKALEQFIKLNPRESIKKGTVALYLNMAALPTSGPNPDDTILREYTSGTRFRNGDTLFARITPCLENGKTAFLQALPKDTVGWGSTEFIVMRAIPPVTSVYPYLLARDPAFRAHAIQSMTGTSGRQRARTEALAPYQVAYPTAEVWTAFALIIEPLFSKIHVNSEESRTLAGQRDALLPRLVLGKLRLNTLDIL